MTLLTMVELTREALPDAPDGALVTRRGIGSSRYDLVLIAPTPGVAETVHRLAGLFRRAGHTVGEAVAGDDRAPRPDTTQLDDALCSVVVVPERERIGSQWFWWLWGRAEAVTRRQAMLPISTKDSAKPPAEFRPRIPSPLTAFPYLGRSRAVGEEVDSIWVAPAGAPTTTRDAVNLDFWIHER